MTRLQGAAAEIALEFLSGRGRGVPAEYRRVEAWPVEVGFDPTLALFGILAVRVSTADGRHRIEAATPASFGKRRRSTALSAAKAAWGGLLQAPPPIWRRMAAVLLAVLPASAALFFALPLSIFEISLARLNSSGFGRPSGGGRPDGTFALLLTFLTIPYFLLLAIAGAPYRWASGARMRERFTLHAPSAHERLESALSDPRRL